MDDESGESMETMEEVPPKETDREKESGASRGIPDDTDCVLRISMGKLRMLLERLTVFVNVPLKLLSPEALFSPKCINIVWRPGSARTRWRSLQRSPRSRMDLSSGVLLKIEVGIRKGAWRRV